MWCDAMQRNAKQCCNVISCSVLWCNAMMYVVQCDDMQSYVWWYDVTWCIYLYMECSGRYGMAWFGTCRAVWYVLVCGGMFWQDVRVCYDMLRFCRSILWYGMVSYGMVQYVCGMCVRMYVRVCVCPSRCTYVYVHVYVYICICVYVYVCIYVLCICVLCVCVYVCMCV